VERILKSLQKEEFENPQEARDKLRAINQKLNLVKILEIDLIASRHLQKL
jgi:hypothetical protein